MYIYCILFILLVFFSVENELRPIKHTNFYLISICTILILFAGFRGISVSRDYVPYLGSFNAVMHDGNSGGAGFLPLFEPGFLLIVKCSFYLFENNGPLTVMIIFAFLSIVIKTLTFKKLAINPFLVLLLYYVHFFLLQEMTQIRNGLACSFLYVAIISHLQNKARITFFWIFLASLFHISSLFYLLLLFLKKDTLNAYIYVGLLIAAIVFGLLKLPLLSSIAGFDLNLISNKLTTYAELADKGFSSNTRFFNVLNTLNVIITFAILFYYLKLNQKPPALTIFLKCNIISIFCYGLLINVPSIASRVAELFGAVSPFLYCYLIKLIPNKKVGLIVLITIALMFFYINLFYGKLLGEYTIMPIHFS
jgi:hypothetical protein